MVVMAASMAAVAEADGDAAGVTSHQLVSRWTSLS